MKKIRNKTTKELNLITLLIAVLSICNMYSFSKKPIHQYSNDAPLNVKLTMQAAFVVGPHALFMRNNKIGRYYLKHKRQLGIGKLNIGSWSGIPENIDAALYHPENKKAYFFKGNMYYQFNLQSKKVEITGKIGVRGWKGLTGGYDAAVAHPTNRHAYFFKGSKYYKYSFAERKMVSSGTIGIDGWRGVPSNVDLAFLHPDGTAYFFDDNKFYRYNFKKKRVDYSLPINPIGMRDIFKTVDAALKNTKGETHFILDSKVPEQGVINSDNGLLGNLFYDIPGIVNKKLGQERYTGIMANVDAGMYRKTTKTAYLFKGKYYYEYKNGTTKLLKKAIIGAAYFKGIPHDIDACLVHDNGKAYFFKGKQYYRYDFDKNRMDQQGTIGVDAWHFVPKNLEAAYYENGKGYFYKQSIKYTYVSATKKVTTSESF